MLLVAALVSLVFTLHYYYKGGRRHTQSMIPELPVDVQTRIFTIATQQAARDAAQEANERIIQNHVVAKSASNQHYWTHSCRNLELHGMEVITFEDDPTVWHALMSFVPVGVSRTGTRFDEIVVDDGEGEVYDEWNSHKHDFEIRSSNFNFPVPNYFVSDILEVQYINAHHDTNLHFVYADSERPYFMIGAKEVATSFAPWATTAKVKTNLSGGAYVLYQKEMPLDLEWDGGDLLDVDGGGTRQRACGGSYHLL